MSSYALGEGALLGTFFSGVNDRGGVFEVEVRLPRVKLGSHAATFCRIFFCWLFVCTRNEITLRSRPIANRIRVSLDGVKG
jgi:hypothetical protein